MADLNNSSPFPDPEVPDMDSAGRYVPPWVKYPNLRRGSMGWRMGAGEIFLYKLFNPWWTQLSRADRAEYLINYQPPTEWVGFLNPFPLPDPEIPDLDTAGRYVPPWIKYPNRSPGSSIWRWGVGKVYVRKFTPWWKQLGEVDQKEYQLEYPLPPEWHGFYELITKAELPHKKRKREKE